MYIYLLLLHSVLRWFVLVLLLLATYRSWQGWLKNRAFTKSDNILRHWTATAAHLQMMVGVILYAMSPITKHYWSKSSEGVEAAFFPVIHLLMMFAAIVLLTIGSAMAKRKQTDLQRFRTMTIYFTFSLLLILIAIPWPFSPLSQRPYIRWF